MGCSSLPSSKTHNTQTSCIQNCSSSDDGYKQYQLNKLNAGKFEFIHTLENHNHELLILSSKIKFELQQAKDKEEVSKIIETYLKEYVKLTEKKFEKYFFLLKKYYDYPAIW